MHCPSLGNYRLGQKFPSRVFISRSFSGYSQFYSMGKVTFMVACGEELEEEGPAESQVVISLICDLKPQQSHLEAVGTLPTPPHTDCPCQEPMLSELCPKGWSCTRTQREVLGSERPISEISQQVMSWVLRRQKSPQYNHRRELLKKILSAHPEVCGQW